MTVRNCNDALKNLEKILVQFHSYWFSTPSLNPLLVEYNCGSAQFCIPGPIPSNVLPVDEFNSTTLTNKCQACIFKKSIYKFTTFFSSFRIDHANFEFDRNRTNNNFHNFGRNIFSQPAFCITRKFFKNTFLKQKRPLEDAEWNGLNFQYRISNLYSKLMTRFSM